MTSHILINPKAGLLKGLTEPKEIKEHLGGLKMDPEISIATTSRGIQSFIDKVKRDKADVALVAGGDGTVATVIKGLLGTDVTIGLLPTGSTNNIGQSLGLGDEMGEYIEVINRGKTARMDVGRVNGEIFIESVGIGLLAQIMDRVGEQDSKKEVLKVITHTVAELASANVIPVHMLNGSEEQVFNTVWLTVTNTGRAAAALVDPTSDVHDKKLEVVYCEPLAGRELGRYVMAFIRNSHIREDKFHRITVKNITLTVPPDVQTHVDGVLHQWDKLEIEVVPGAIKVFVP